MEENSKIKNKNKKQKKKKMTKVYVQKNITTKPKTKKKKKQNKSQISLGLIPSKPNNSRVAFKGTQDSIRVTGTELWGAVATTSDFYVADGIIDINPGLATFGCPRLRAQSRTFEYFSLNKITLVYASVCNMSANGCLHLCTEYDPLDVPLSTMEAIYGQHKPITYSVRSGFTYNVDVKGMCQFNRYKIVHPEDDMVERKDIGQFYPIRIYLASDSGPEPPLLAGVLSIAYDITMYEAHMDHGGIAFTGQNTSISDDSGKNREYPWDIYKEIATTVNVPEDLRDYLYSSYNDVAGNYYPEINFLRALRGNVTGFVTGPTLATGIPGFELWRDVAGTLTNVFSSVFAEGPNVTSNVSIGDGFRMLGFNMRTAAWIMAGDILRMASVAFTAKHWKLGYGNSLNIGGWENGGKMDAPMYKTITLKKTVRSNSKPKPKILDDIKEVTKYANLDHSDDEEEQKIVSTRKLK